MTCRISRFQDGGSFQQDPLVTTYRLKIVRRIVANQIRRYKQITLEFWIVFGVSISPLLLQFFN